MNRAFSAFRAAAAALAAACAAFAAPAQERVQARINATSVPSGAILSVDGKERGTTPLTLFDLEPGVHHLKFRLDGYEDADLFADTEAEGPFVEKNAVLEEVKGLLLIKTEPPGASVDIGGASAGVTPLLVTTLPARDSYVVKLRKAGYQDQTLHVRFEGRRPVVREERLVLSSGTVNVTSDPPGAEVMLNGIARGVTPILVRGVQKGRAAVTLSMEGFRTETRELAINAGDVQALHVPLQGLPGTLTLVSSPEGARFYLNGEPRGRGPVSIPALAPGVYSVRAELEGYGTSERSVTVEKGQAQTCEFKLSSVMGRIEVRTAPAGAQVWIDGRLAGVTKKRSQQSEYSDVFPIENVLEGEHSLVFKCEGHADSTRTVTVENMKTVQVRRRLARIFTPDVKITTAHGSHLGVMVKNSPDLVEIEVKPGINQSFPRTAIRKIEFLGKGK